LGQALFDEIDDLHLNRPGVDQDHINTRARIMELRRHDRVENWLREVVKKEVEEDLKVLASTSIPSSSAAKTTSGAERIFTLLTGHQISRACESAVTSNDLRLATLVAQASAGGAVDDEFKSDIYLQLVKWREYGVEEWVSAGVRKVYLLLCGEVSGNVVDGKLSRGETEPEIIHVMKGLDWKRAFGLHLWFGGGGNIDGVSSLERAVERYESASTGDKVVARPSPSYCVDSTTSSAPVPPSTGELPTDPLFHLLKLFTSPTHPLESALLPTNFGPSSLDYRLPWTLYLLFSRVLRRRDFEDRTLIDQDQMMDIPSDVVVEGNSVRADMVTETYANQLEAEGNWTWAIFVLLHLELTDR
jgi:nuclear pore complex protein Nup98-Nup96